MSMRVSSPPLCSCRLSDLRKKQREARQWGRKMGASTFFFFPLPLLFLFPLHPLSGCHVLFVSWGRLSGSGDGERGSLAWLESREDLVAWSSGLCSHGRQKQRESAMEGGWERERVKKKETEREREMHPLSHVFDRGVFPTGVKKGRADWADWAQPLTHTHTHTHTFCHFGGHCIDVRGFLVI